MSVVLSNENFQRLLKELESCTFVRPIGTKAQAMLLSYEDSLDTSDLEVEDEVVLEFFSASQFFEEALSRVGSCGVDARIFAYRNLPKKAKRALQKIADGTSPKYAADLDALASKDKPSLAHNLRRVLESLKVKCVFSFSEDAPLFEGSAAAYDPMNNTLMFSTVDSTVLDQETRSAYTTVMLHLILHELAHVVEPSDIERYLVDEDFPDLLQSRFGRGADRYFLSDIARASEAFKETINYVTHSARFRLVLIYLQTMCSRKFLVRPSFVRHIIKDASKINPFYTEDDGPDVDLDMPTDSDLVFSITYDWEKPLKEYLKKRSSKLKFKPASSVTKTRSLREAWLKGARSNYATTPLSKVKYASTMFSFEGTPNLLRIDLKGIDPLHFICALLLQGDRQGFHEDNIAYGIPALVLTMQSGLLVPLYTDGASEFEPVTLEDLWWLMTL